MVEVFLENLTKYFGDVRAIENFSVRIKDKEFLTLLGPSGCGKTTTLRCIAGLETLTAGDIYIADHMVTDLPPKDRDIAMVFQTYALYPHMKVFDNIAFPLKMHKVPKDEIRRKVKETAELLKITELLDRKPKELSGGQMQRVALGRAIVREPKVFLMDEPLSNLDAKLRAYMRAELKALQKRIGTTTIYVTHDQLEAMTMSDRVAILKNGFMQQLSSPSEIYANPENMFVAGFIGSPPMNFMDCSFVEKGEKAFLDTAFVAIDVTDFKDVIKEKATSPELVFSVRPEEIHVHKERVSEEAIGAEIYVMEPLGAELLLTLLIGDTIFKVKVAPGFKAHPGKKVWITFNKKKIHIFDKKIERVII